MRAARLVEYGKPLELMEVETPKIGRHDALVRIKACGVCHTDLHLQEGSMRRGRLPLTLGHEMAGEVAEAGEEADWLKPGTRVVVDYHYTCGRCHNCRVGLEEQCTGSASAGFDVDGGYAEYAKAPARNLVELHDGVSYEDGATLACGGATVYHAIRSAPVLFAESILIYGFGGLGTIALQVAKLTGARTFVVDIAEEKLALAQRLGADGVIDASKQDVVKETRALTGGLGVDKVFDLVAAPETLENSLQVLRRGGRLIIIGALSKPFRANPLELLRARTQIHGQGGCPRWQLEELVQLVNARRVKPVVSTVYPLEDVNKALKELRGGRILGRAVIKP
ncbi:MAG: alcohol dehydrogenase catalytic domain-containing protein [Candidatus Bathyarchaeia archaeon]